MTAIIPDPVAAHRQSFRNQVGVLGSKLCACFHCLAMFPRRRSSHPMREAQRVPLTSF